MRKSGVSPIIAFVSVLAVAFTAVSILSTFGLSQVEQLRDTAAIEEMTTELQQIGDEIDSTAALAEDTQTTVSLQIDRGSLRYEDQALIFEVLTQSGIVAAGSRQQNGNVFLSADARSSLQTDTVDGQDCYRLENEHVSACINAYGGDQNSFTSGSLNDLILEMDNRHDGRTYEPTIQLRLNDDQAYTDGMINVVPDRVGPYLGEASLTIYVNPTDRPVYELSISLPSGADFLQTEIR